jgi:YidC/Oxa1 family membrane protein insertase
MDQKRFLLFIVLSMTILIGWSAYVEPLLRPKPVARNPAAPAKDAEAARDVAGENPPAQAADDDTRPEAKPDADPGPAKAVAKADEAPAEKPDALQPPALKPPEFEEETVLLGSDDPKSAFRQLVTLTSRGAAVERIELNDPRYKALHKPHPPLAIVGSDEIEPFTLAMSVPQINAQADLTRVNWQVVDRKPPQAPHSEATFRLRIGELEIDKRYALGVVDSKENREAPAYELTVDLTFHNLAGKPRKLNYELQGPTGVPLENVENTQKYRDVVAGFVSGPGTAKHELMTAKTIAEGPQEWKTPFDYIGIDAQYFTALLLPLKDQRETPYIRSATQKLLGPPLAERSEIGVLLTSVDVELAAAADTDGKDAATHSYRLFAGPKRDDVLPSGTAKLIDYGWLEMICRPMLALLKAFHALAGSWGIAIICLTVVVRGAMFPISIQQARGAAKMQQIQPEIAALKEKYGKDREKMARAQMELFRKHNYNPAKGCLPLFLQLPIFMGLYTALNLAVDLRMAKFLWIQNLAAPDALFQLPFAVPFFGWKEFNLLPLITTGLFIVQQKMFMPPPTNDEQAMQQKMMNFMTVIMGVMFYKVPAGLCVYFIASSLWGMAERKLLPKAKPATAPPASAAGGAGGSGGEGPRGPGRAPRKPSGNDDPEEPDGFFARLLKAGEKETSARRSHQGKRK